VKAYATFFIPVGRVLEFWSNEPAWEPHIAAQVVEWLGLHQYAVLGTELWVIRDGLGMSSEKHFSLPECQIYFSASSPLAIVPTLLL